MQKLLLFIIIVLNFFAAKAQPAINTFNHSPLHRLGINPLNPAQKHDNSRSIQYYLVGLESDNWDGISNWEHADSGKFDLDVTGKEIDYLLLIGLTGAWGNAIKLTYSYNGGPYLLGYLDQRWDDQHTQFVNYEQVAYVVDGAGYQTELSTKMWNAGNNSWLDSSKYNYTYDSNHHLTGEMMQQWDTVAGSWINVYDSLYTYNANGYKTSTLGKSWNTGTNQWDSLYKAVYTWNGNRLTGQITQVDDLVNMLHAIKYTYVYDANSNMTGCEIFTWNAGTQVWDKFTRYTYTYNTGNQLIEAVNEDWNQTYLNNGRDIYTYNANGDRASDEFFGWDAGAGQWGPQFRSTFNYDSNHDLTYEFDEMYGANNAYENYWRYFYYYQPFNINGIADLRNTSEVGVYPNPATNQLFIQSNGQPVTEINIYDVTGNLVNQTKQLQNNSIDISELATGVYVAEIKTPKSPKGDFNTVMRRWAKR